MRCKAPSFRLRTPAPRPHGRPALGVPFGSPTGQLAPQPPVGLPHQLALERAFLDWDVARWLHNRGAHKTAPDLLGPSDALRVLETTRDMSEALFADSST